MHGHSRVPRWQRAIRRKSKRKSHLGVGIGTIKMLIHRLRKQYLAAVREEVARTVLNPAGLKARSARCVMRWSPPKDG